MGETNGHSWGRWEGGAAVGSGFGTDREASILLGDIIFVLRVRARVFGFVRGAGSLGWGGVGAEEERRGRGGEEGGERREVGVYAYPLTTFSQSVSQSVGGL